MSERKYLKWNGERPLYTPDLRPIRTRQLYQLKQVLGLSMALLQDMAIEEFYVRHMPKAQSENLKNNRQES
jgi:hypothetical protein